MADAKKRRSSGAGLGSSREDDFTKGVGGPALEGEKLDMFYEAPPGLVKEAEERPEDAVPDLPGNEQVREFLAKAPTKGLWMPLGKEVKCMQCWRCKQYGHRTGDRECPLRDSGNLKSEAERQARMDPMYQLMQQNKGSSKESEPKGQSLRDLAKQLMEMAEEKKRKKKEKKEKKEKERKKKEKKEKKEKKRKREKEERQRSRGRDRESRERGRSRDRDRDRDDEHDQDRDRSRDRKRDREAGRDRSRERDRDRDRNHERESRDRDRSRDRDHDRERDRKDKDRKRDRHSHRETKRRRRSSDSESSSD